MSAYYYLISQLPYLTYGQKPPMSSDSFVEFACTKMSKTDSALLSYCTLGSKAEAVKPTPSKFINEWQRWEKELTLNLAQARASKRGRSVNYEISREFYNAETQAKTAIAMDNPLEAEIYLDQGRWQAIERFQGVNYFDVSVVYAYLLKLRLVERRARQDVDEGFEEYQTLYGSIMEDAPQVSAGR
ncbi:MAG: DUF2764 family protein [Termitinemataceae bacterium]|nr:MAG: DUF2764 family protein [Termitinemataceae bacterium]